MTNYIKGRTIAIEAIGSGDLAKHIATVAQCPDALRGFADVIEVVLAKRK